MWRYALGIALFLGACVAVWFIFAPVETYENLVAEAAVNLYQHPKLPGYAFIGYYNDMNSGLKIGPNIRSIQLPEWVATNKPDYFSLQYYKMALPSPTVRIFTGTTGEVNLANLVPLEHENAGVMGDVQLERDLGLRGIPVFHYIGTGNPHEVPETARAVFAKLK